MPLNDEVLLRLSDDAVAMSDEFEARHAALEKCLAKLGEEERRFIIWRYQQELAVRDMADRLGVTPQAVYKALTRVHESLLRCIRRTLVECNE